MSVGIGIVGLASSGRTTIFNALTRGKADTGGFGGAGASHIGMARVPDARLGVLADLLHPKKVVPTEIRYLDIGASVKSLAKEGGVSGELLTQLSGVDALLNVVRAFADPAIPHPAGGIDVARDIAEMDMELAFSDLAIIERRFDRIGSSLKGAKADERAHLLHEQELLHRIKDELEKDIPLREQKLSEEERHLIAGFQFLSAKPLMTLVNIGEEDLPRAQAMEAELNQRFGKPHHCLIVLAGKLEMELGELDEATAKECRAEFGLTESGLERAIRTSYDLLGLITFFTTASDELKAWPIPRGTVAQRAAGKVHTDMERGFIRAEVVSYKDLVECSSLAEARKRGLLRLEGKSYVVQDGDVINYLFNV